MTGQMVGHMRGRGGAWERVIKGGIISWLKDRS